MSDREPAPQVDVPRCECGICELRAENKNLKAAFLSLIEFWEFTHEAPPNVVVEWLKESRALLDNIAKEDVGGD